MAFKFTYNRFFSVNVKKHDDDLLEGHETEEDKALRVLEFTPTAECNKFMKNHNLVFRRTNTGFEVFYRSNDNSEEAITSPIVAKTRFSFGAKVIDPNFFDNYIPNADNEPQFYLDNLTNSGNMTGASVLKLTKSSYYKKGDAAIIQKQSFTQRTEIEAAAPTEWLIKEKFNPQDTVKTISIVNDDNLDLVQVRINDPLLSADDYIHEPGVFAMESNAPDAKQTTLYLSDELAGKSMNGVLDIYWDSSQDNAPNNTGKQYYIIFKLK